MDLDPISLRGSAPSAEMGDEEPPEWAAEPTGAAVSRVPLIDECVRAALRARRSAPLDTHAHTLATLTLVYRARFCCDGVSHRCGHGRSHGSHVEQAHNIIKRLGIEFPILE